jgi:hypothetical protein
MATIDQLKKHYDKLTARERFALIMGAYARMDEPTIDELLASAPRKIFSMPHTRGLTDGFQFAAMYHMIDQLGWAASMYWFMQASEGEKSGKVITIGSVTYDLDDVLTNVFKRMLSNAEAWREMCQEYKIDPEGVLQHYPHAPMLEMIELIVNGAAVLMGEGGIDPREKDETLKTYRMVIEHHAAGWE